MAEHMDISRVEQLRVAPGRPKGSGSRALWIALALLAVAIALAIVISSVIAVMVLRS